MVISKMKDYFGFRKNDCWGTQYKKKIENDLELLKGIKSNKTSMKGKVKIWTSRDKDWCKMLM